MHVKLITSIFRILLLFLIKDYYSVQLLILFWLLYENFKTTLLCILKNKSNWKKTSIFKPSSVL